MTMILRFCFAVCVICSSALAAPEPNKWRADAFAIPQIINDQYAYLDHLPGGKFALTPRLDDEAWSFRCWRPPSSWLRAARR